jgi:hypothetical protein
MGSYATVAFSSKAREMSVRLLSPHEMVIQSAPLCVFQLPECINEMAVVTCVAARMVANMTKFCTELNRTFARSEFSCRYYGFIPR